MFGYDFFSSLSSPCRSVFLGCLRAMTRFARSRASVALPGVSRSATAVISYLMRASGVSAEAALQHLRRVRPAAQPNPGFRKQLLAYEAELRQTQAAHAVAAASSVTAPASIAAAARAAAR